MKKIYVSGMIVLGMISCKTTRMAQTSGVPNASREQYLQQYKDIAIKEMNRARIPASITLAQGMLESNNGNSRLAREANNHFGIKCHRWTGKKIYHDDDKRNECFRKYNSPVESYVDHSEFLRSSQRYAFLFELKPTDYKSWAKGLKKAGYATDPSYAHRLITIIEANKLYLFDNGQSPVITAQYDQPNETATSPITESTRLADIDNFTISLNNRKVMIRNRIEYILVKEGDTFHGLTQELDLMPWELPKYNELPQDATLQPGQILYIQPKRNKADVGMEYHTVKDGETLYSVSQLYGIKLSSLYKMNQIEERVAPEPGQKLWLRRKK